MRMPNPFHAKTCFALLWSASNLTCEAFAQTHDETLETITVTASRHHRAISDIPATVWVIDQETLKQAVRTGADLKNILGRLIPSLDFGDQSRTNFGQNLRGRRALVMIDGVSLNASRQISRQLDSIDPFNIERIEVLSGATSLYGAGAAGGIINILTKSGQGASQFEAKVGLVSGLNDSDDKDTQAALAANWNTSHAHGRVALAYSETGAKFDANGERVFSDITQTDTQFNDTFDAQISVTYQPTQAQSVSFLGQYYKSEQDTEYGADLGPNLVGIFGAPERIQISQGLRLSDQPETQRDLYQLQYQHDSLLSHQLLAQLYHRTESFRFFPFPFIFRVQGSPLPGDSFPVYGASKQNTDITGLKLAMTYMASPWVVSYGLDADTESFDASQTLYDIGTALASGGLVFSPDTQIQRYPDVDTRHWALFLQADWKASQHWQISAGIRHQYTQHDIDSFTGVLQQHLAGLGFYPIEPEAIPGGKTHFTESLYTLGVVYQINDDQQIWANYNQGFDLPDPVRFYGLGQYNGLYGEGPLLLDSVDIASSQLEGIKTDSYELGWRRFENRYHAQISAYYSLSDKSIAFNPNTLSIDLNDDEKRVFGVEAQLTLDFSDYIYMSLYAHIINSDVKKEGVWTALTAQEASADKGAFELGYKDDEFAVALQWQTTRDYEDNDGHRLEGFHLANINGFYQLDSGKLTFGIQNLLDKHYQTTWSQRAQIIYGTLSAPELFNYPGQGRRFAVGFEFEF